MTFPLSVIGSYVINNANTIIAIPTQIQHMVQDKCLPELPFHFDLLVTVMAGYNVPLTHFSAA